MSISAPNNIVAGDSGGQHLLVFGATGAIGQAVCARAAARGWQVSAVARTAPDTGFAPDFTYDPFHDTNNGEALRPTTLYTAVCWAQGANCTDSVFDFRAEAHLELYRANVLYILLTMQTLLAGAMLAPAARMCVISSIWQNLARQTKLSYCVSKAAVGGLVRSAAADLAQHGHLINAVLPGALDTPMTRQNLSAGQMETLASATGFGRLPALDDVASLVCFLCSPENTGITGQSIAADLGFSHVRFV